MSDVRHAEPYFQFPLCLLAYGPDPVSRLRSVVDYCLVVTGADLAQKLPPDEEERIIASFPAEHRPVGIESRKRWHRDVLVAMHHLCIRHGRIAEIQERHCRAQEFITAFRLCHGPSPQVRIAARYVWEVIKGNGMSYRNFSVLCAIYSVIGSKGYPVLIRRDRIIAAALGYKSPGMLAGESRQTLLASREDCAKPLTVDQLRWTLDTLEIQGHFARCQAGKRRVYFSHRIPRDQMAGWLEMIQMRRAATLRRHRERDRQLQARIKVGNRGTPHFNTGEIPHVKTVDQAPHALPAEPPQSPHGTPHFNKNSLIETSLIETALIQTGAPPNENCHRMTAALIQPTLEAVQQFARSLHRDAEPFAEAWSREFGSDPR